MKLHTQVDRGPELRKAFDVYAAKGSVNYPGPMRTAYAAFRVFKHLLTMDERNALRIARAHALDAVDTLGFVESRREFDDVCKKIRKRLSSTFRKRSK